MFKLVRNVVSAATCHACANKFTAIAVGLIVCITLASCVNMRGIGVVPTLIPGATYVGNDLCADCHEQVAKKFLRSVHAGMTVRGADAKGETGCEACHGPGSKHVDADDHEKAATIVNPEESAEACYACHFDKESQFSLRYHHPVPEGKMTCADCHDTHGADPGKPAKMNIARSDASCAQCHKDQTRPRLFEHEALREGCASCHDFHGSIDDKMLVENDNNLCFKCHAQVQTGAGVAAVGTRNHHSNIARATCWGAGCHTAVHGSNVDSHLRY